MNRPVSGFGALAGVLLLGGCGGSWEKRYHLERSRLLHAERYIRNADREIRTLHNARRDRRQRLARLERCLLKAMRSLKPRPQKRLLRVAARVVVADTPARARGVGAPPFKWPWKRVTRRRSGPGQVCAVNRRRWRPDPLTPQAARPCRRGLRCCYPCGIAGCNSVCMRRCPRGLP